jgi:filamentous hemagglutinin family protein
MSITQRHQTPIALPRLRLLRLSVATTIAVTVATPAVAQITSSTANTTLTINGNETVITGELGSLSGGGGENQFHLFSQFNLANGQTATFSAPATVSNILAGVNGGNASVIDGLVKVTGGNSPNLYLINPTGIIFGPNAAINVPNAFVATTANGIGFAGGKWFSLAGTSNFGELSGSPLSFGFTMAQPAAIVNTANLISPVNLSGSLTLLAGTVISPGNLTTLGFNRRLTIAAVPGQSIVQITSKDNLGDPPTGNYLGITIQPFAATTTQPNPWTAPVPSLAQLITGPGPGGTPISDATGIRANVDGTVSLTGSTIAAGDIYTANLESNGVLISAPQGNVTVSTIRANDLGVDITAGKLFRATGILNLPSYTSLFRYALADPSIDLLGFLQLKTGLSAAEIISKYPDGFAPRVVFPTAASIYVGRGVSRGDGAVRIRHGTGSSVVAARANNSENFTVSSTGNAPFSLGGKVTLNAPDLADRYQFVDPTTTFPDLAASVPPDSNSFGTRYNLIRNQTVAPTPIPANSSGTVGAIVQLLVTDGSLTIGFQDRVFGQLPTTTVDPIAPNNTANPGNPAITVTPDNPITVTPLTPSIVVDRTGNCAPAAGRPGTNTASRSSATGPCEAIERRNNAILKILE